ncbi:putative sodium-coupled neutral amino acid transporter 11 isoform X2 [Apostichopus japonicus]|uniref:putative sodium-coupled neutral amino acid transporter 11 isoform X2 n=1 Tax=Stichopus japonicus TaxID=307972 RepID=UPI003AB1709E
MESHEPNERSRIADDPPYHGTVTNGGEKDDLAPVNNSDGIKLIEEEEPTQPTSGLTGGSVNLANSILGSGIIGTPYAFKQAGLPLGVILLFAIAGITDYSLNILMKAAELAGSRSYQDLLQASYGLPGYYFLTCIQFAYPLVAMIGYHVIIGDTISQVCERIFGENHVLANRYFVISVITLLILLPLSFYKNVTKLVKVAFLSMVLLILLCVVIIIRIGTIDIEVEPGDWNFANINAIESVSILTFAFVCHHNAFLIFASLETPTQTMWKKVTHYAVVMATIFLLIVGVTGYITFKHFTQGDLLQNYCYTDDLVNIARVAFAITIMCTYPLECLVCREVVENFIVRHGWVGSEPTLERHLINTLIIVGIALGVSMSTECLGLVLILNGIFGAIPLIMILPAACYIRWEGGKWYGWQKLPAICLLVVGIAVVISGIITIFVDHTVAECKTGEAFDYCNETNIQLDRQLSS